MKNQKNSSSLNFKKKQCILFNHCRTFGPVLDIWSCIKTSKKIFGPCQKVLDIIGSVPKCPKRHLIHTHPSTIPHKPLPVRLPKQKGLLLTIPPQHNKTWYYFLGLKPKVKINIMGQLNPRMFSNRGHFGQDQKSADPRNINIKN